MTDRSLGIAASSGHPHPRLSSRLANSVPRRTPISEAIAGLLVGALLMTVLGVIPQLSPLFDRRGLPLYALIAIGALLGAIASYVLARAHPPMIVDRELAEGDYVVIAEPPLERRAA